MKLLLTCSLVVVCLVQSTLQEECTAIDTCPGQQILVEILDDDVVRCSIPEDYANCVKAACGEIPASYMQQAKKEGESYNCDWGNSAHHVTSSSLTLVTLMTLAFFRIF